MRQCTVCGDHVSEWAAYCPCCGASLADAPPITEADPPAPPSGAHTQPAPAEALAATEAWREATTPIRSDRSRGTRRLVAATAAVVVVAIGWMVLHSSSSTEPVREQLPTSEALTTAQLPMANGPRQGVIVYALPDKAQIQFIDLASGDSDSIEMPAEGYPERPFLSGHSFVFVAAGEAWAADARADGSPPDEWHYRAIGKATHVIPSETPDSVWLVRGDPPDTVEVERVELNGFVLTEPTLLPPGSTAIAPVRTALLLLQRDHGAIQLFNPANNTVGPDIGSAIDVLDTDGSVIAWLEGEGSPAVCPDTGCRLHLTGIAQGDDRVVDPPEGALWVWGGAISPDGTTLAAFVDASPFTDGGFSSPGAALVLVDIAAGAATPIAESQVAVGEPVVAATWSSTSQWLFFSGLSDPMRGYQPGQPAAVKLALPGSYTFAVT